MMCGVDAPARDDTCVTRTETVAAATAHTMAADHDNVGISLSASDNAVARQVSAADELQAELSAEERAELRELVSATDCTSNEKCSVDNDAQDDAENRRSNEDEQHRAHEDMIHGRAMEVCEACDTEDDTEKRSNCSSPLDAINSVPFRSNNATTSVPTHIDLRLLVRRREAGALIGKRGANIKRLRDTFKGCSLSIPDTGNGPERVVCISADNERSLESILTDLTRLLMEKSPENDEQIEVKLLIHSSHAGSIIGIGGQSIKKLRNDSKAAIKIFEMCCPLSNERVCAIKARPAIVVQTIKMIRSILNDNPAKGTVKPYDALHFDLAYVDKYGGYPPDEPLEALLASHQFIHTQQQQQQQYPRPVHNSHIQPHSLPPRNLHHHHHHQQQQQHQPSLHSHASTLQHLHEVAKSLSSHPLGGYEQPQQGVCRAPSSHLISKHYSVWRQSAPHTLNGGAGTAVVDNAPYKPRGAHRNIDVQHRARRYHPYAAPVAAPTSPHLYDSSAPSHSMRQAMLAAAAAAAAGGDESASALLLHPSMQRCLQYAAAAEAATAAAAAAAVAASSSSSSSVRHAAYQQQQQQHYNQQLNVSSAAAAAAAAKHGCSQSACGCAYAVCSEASSCPSDATTTQASIVATSAHEDMLRSDVSGGVGAYGDSEPLSSTSTTANSAQSAPISNKHFVPSDTHMATSKN